MFSALVSPKATFEDIARRPSWVAPVILLTVVSLAATVLLTQRVGWLRIVQQQIERNPRAAERLNELSLTQREQVLARNGQIYKVVAYKKYVVAVVGPLVIVAIVALILMGLANLLCGASVKYRTSLAVTTHAWMPAAIAGLLVIIVLLLKSPDAVDVERLVASNLGASLESDSPRWLFSLASAVDLFAFWRILLLAIGLAAVTPKKVTVGKALAIVFGAYAVFALLAAGVAAAFS